MGERIVRLELRLDQLKLQIEELAIVVRKALENVVAAATCEQRHPNKKPLPERVGPWLQMAVIIAALLGGWLKLQGLEFSVRRAGDQAAAAERARPRALPPQVIVAPIPQRPDAAVVRRRRIR